jgi:hypothetical protein
MNIKRGAFRLWVVVTVLWVGLVGWSLAETFPGAWREGCFHDDGIWWAPAAHKTPLKPGDVMPPGVDDWEDAHAMHAPRRLAVQYNPASAGQRRRPARWFAGHLACWRLGATRFRCVEGGLGAMNASGRPSSNRRAIAGALPGHGVETNACNSRNPRRNRARGAPLLAWVKHGDAQRGVRRPMFGA